MPFYIQIARQLKYILPYAHCYVYTVYIRSTYLLPVIYILTMCTKFYLHGLQCSPNRTRKEKYLIEI
jgi:hypothetical protein